MKVHLTYFKESGKYYGDGEYTTDLKYMHEITEEVRRMKEHPDLLLRWNDYILVTGDGDTAYPCLIVPERMRK